jgi:hypothetical protein
VRACARRAGRQRRFVSGLLARHTQTASLMSILTKMLGGAAIAAAALALKGNTKKPVAAKKVTKKRAAKKTKAKAKARRGSKRASR